MRIAQVCFDVLLASGDCKSSVRLCLCRANIEQLSQMAEHIHAHPETSFMPAVRLGAVRSKVNETNHQTEPQ